MPLHENPFYAARHDGRALPNAQRFADGLVRLPMFYDLTTEQVGDICAAIREFYAARG